MTIFKHDSPALKLFNQLRREGMSLTVDAVSPEMLIIQDRDEERVFVKAEDIDQLIETLQAFKAAREYDRLADKELALLGQWKVA